VLVVVLVISRALIPAIRRDQGDERGMTGPEVVLAHDLGQDVAFSEDLDLCSIHFNVGSAVLAKQHLVTDGNGDGASLAAVQQASGTDGNDGATLRLFLGAVRQDDSASGGFLGVQGLNNNAIIKRIQFHL
jgi:hypothetical protein